MRVLTACVCLGRGRRMGRWLSNTGLSGTLPEGVGRLTSLQDMCVLGGGASYGGRHGGAGAVTS
eukprot:COSAG05_NODE_2448_length_3055_cov_3.566982_1_plen_64_part_00